MDMDRVQALEQRLQRLEDIEAIRELKARYLNACDRKQPDEVRDCFAEGEVLIDYAHIGTFRSRDDFVKVFEEMGCHDHIIDMHHGSNPRIEITGPDTARGEWALYYHNIETEQGALTQLAALYDDEYVRTRDGWRISRTVVHFLSTLMATFSDDGVQVVRATQKPT